MTTIYKPEGRAREYSPLALNLYNGCDSQCFYCWVNIFRKRYNPSYIHSEVKPKDNIIQELEKQSIRFRNNKQVLLSFSGDPYCQLNNKYQLTSKALEILLKYRIPVSILTKGGMRIMKDIEVIRNFKEGISVGTTLTFSDDIRSKKHEPGATPFYERIDMLRTLKSEGIKTWVSIEPVLNYHHSIECIKESLIHTDYYKIGKLNHFPDLEKGIDWPMFLLNVVTIMRTNNKKFYIKEDLLKFKSKELLLTNQETDKDYLNVRFKEVEQAKLF